MSGQGVVVVDGCRIAYQRAGTDGPPVVLLHGGGVDDATLSWEHTIEALAPDYQVYAPDWPGYGDSDSIDESSITAYIDVLSGFLDAVGLDAIALVGLSMGGAVALGYTLDAPSAVDRLVLVDSYGLGERIPAGSLWKMIASIPGANSLGWAIMGSSLEASRLGLSAVVAEPSSLSKPFLEAFRERATAAGAGIAFEEFQTQEVTADGRAVTNYADELERLTVPTALIHGAADPLFPVAWSRRAYERIPESELIVLSECGHWSPRECPDAFNAALTTFLTNWSEHAQVNSG